MRVTLPTSQELSELIDHRDEASVTIYIPSSPYPRETEAVQLRLKNAINDALSQLKEVGVDTSVRNDLAAALDQIHGDRAFWEHQARSIALFASPQGVHAYRTANSFKEVVAVGDRFDVGPLLRTVTFPNGGYVLTLAKGDIHLYEVRPDQQPVEVTLEDLPDDMEYVLTNQAHDGRFDRMRADGAKGQKIEQQRYSSLVQDAVLKAMDDTRKPLILAASRELEPAYRAINTYSQLLDEGIDPHPESLTTDDIDDKARAILDAYYAAQLADWREHFENQRTQGKATGELDEVARAATAGAVDQLLFNMDSTTLEGHIDDAGGIIHADEAGPHTYGIVDEIAVRVLKAGGTVKAVREGDLPNGGPVAATLRFPISAGENGAPQ